jgi:hypothetical protein
MRRILPGFIRGRETATFAAGKRGSFARKCALLHRKSWPILRKKGRRASLSFRQMSDFKVLAQIFLPALGRGASAKFAEAKADDGGRFRRGSQHTWRSRRIGHPVSGLRDLAIISESSRKGNCFLNFLISESTRRFRSRRQGEPILGATSGETGRLSASAFRFGREFV